MIRQVISIAENQERGSQVYSITCFNDSAESKYFYMYQRTSNQLSKTASVVWSRSDSKIGTNTSITFEWEKKYCFIWQGYGLVQPGRIFNARGFLSASSKITNATFSISDSLPSLKANDNQSEEFELIIKNDKNIPGNEYAIGIGMDDNATFLEQAHANEIQCFNCDSSYWLAFGDNINEGMVLSNSCSDPKIELTFPTNIYELKLRFDGNKFSPTLKNI